MRATFAAITLIVALNIDTIQCNTNDPLGANEKYVNMIKKTFKVTGYVGEKSREIKTIFNNVKSKLTTYLCTEKPLAARAKVMNCENKEFPCVDDDPAIYMTTPQLITVHGYPAESHTVRTEDGYLLTLHRIPHSKKAVKLPTRTVLLHHGLLGSSADWVLTGPEKSLAYILSDQGFDVWLANARGNIYSRAHAYVNIDTYVFWNFTFHEMGYYDVPAAIDYIRDLKGPDVKIDYIGYSMGTTVLFTMLSTRPEYNAILRAGYALAPVAFMNYINSPIRFLAPYSNKIEYIFKHLGENEFLTHSTFIQWLTKYMCDVTRYEEEMCENALFLICGFDEDQFDKSFLPIILGHTPAGASTKTLVHYAQEISKCGRFQYFDYGPSANFIIYGRLTPPEYNLENITLPIALFSGENDWLSSVKDVITLYNKLPNPIEHYVVPFKDFNHLDFMWARDVNTLVYNRLINLLNQDSKMSPSDKWNVMSKENTIGPIQSSDQVTYSYKRELSSKNPLSLSNMDTIKHIVNHYLPCVSFWCLIN